VYDPKATPPVGVIVQLATTVAVTMKVVVLVAAAAGTEARPSVKHPRMAAGSAYLTVFENFIEMTPEKTNCLFECFRSVAPQNFYR
jgi:hypothetical protein